MDDFRIFWMKEIIYRFLSIEINDQAFEELIKRDENHLKILRSLFSSSEKSPRCIFFYYNIIEEEEEREEKSETPIEKDKASFSSESIKSESDEASATNVDDVLSKDEDPDEEDLSKSSVEKSEHSEDQIEAAKMSRTSLVLIVKKTQLHLCLGITEYVTNQTYMYFLLRKNEPVPTVASMEEAWEVMPGYFDMGRISQHPLVCIHKMISFLYIPLFSDEELKPHMSEQRYAVDENQLSSLVYDFNKEMVNFTDSTHQILQQIEKPFMFSLPNMPEKCKVTELAQETEFIAEAEDMANEWTGLLKDLYEEVSTKKPLEHGLMYEIDFWKTQKLKLSICWDQLNHNTIQRTVTALDLAGCDIKVLLLEVENIERLLNEVTEKVNYLLLLERNIKDLLPGRPFVSAKQSLKDLFTVLKVIWVQSSYYRDAFNMGRLLRGVATILKKKVEAETRNDTLFRKPLEEVRKIVAESTDILEYWKEVYFSECEAVKKYGGAFWWRFDIRLLFDKTDYIISVCKDMGKVSKALQELNNIFNTKLRFFVDDTKRLSTMENRIFGMTALIQYAEFDIFDIKYKSDWDRMMFVFFRDVSNFEEEIKSYVGTLFQSNLTWEHGYILARSFDQQDISPAIKEFIARSSADMLKQFIREISETENEFLAQEQNPPVLDGIPATASAILWAKDLLRKISLPMSKIFDNDAISKRDLEVQERFKKTEKLLVSYQNSKYDAWKTEANEKLNTFLQTNLLTKRQAPSNKFTGGATRLESAVSYAVCFPTCLEEVATEAKILEHLGYEVTSFVASVLLQEKSFIKQRNELTMILKDLENSMPGLQKEEISVLEIPIDELCSVLDLGVNTMQWETTRVPDFLKKSKQAVDVFKDLIFQLRNIFLEIDKKINFLSDFELLEWPEVQQSSRTCEDFFGDAEIRMEKNIVRMVDIYSSLRPLLLKLEVVTCRTSTGKAKQMRAYYHVCEEKVLRALIKMMLSNLEYFQEEVLGHVIFPYIETAFRSTDELITSSIQRIKLIFTIFLRTVIESSRRLIRWLDGTCEESSPFNNEERKLKSEFSYFLDLSLHPQIKDLTLSIISKFFDHVDQIEGMISQQEL